MIKRLKKFTVPYEGTYFDGGKIFGQRVVFAQNEEEATEKVQKSFNNEGEPITYACKARKWKKEDKSEAEIYGYWE